MAISSSSPPRADATTLFIGGRRLGSGDTYERFDPARLQRSTGTYASTTADTWSPPTTPRPAPSPVG